MDFLRRKGDEIEAEAERIAASSFGAKYTLGRKLGEGCSASVYTCKRIDDQSGTVYAVKLCREDDEEKREAQIKEAKII